jgi:hypothetical protein
MMGVEAPETGWATHKRQVRNLWNGCIKLVNLFEVYDVARTCKLQKVAWLFTPFLVTTPYEAIIKKHI